MKKFVLRLVVFCLFQALAISFFWGDKLPGENNYLARTIEKHERLRESERRRLILVGGSNVAFGFVTDELRKGTELTVVNMGLVAGLGLEFMLNEVRSQVRGGDVVVLSPEYDFGGGGKDEQVLKQLLEMRPASARFLTMRDWLKDFADTALNWMGGYLRRAALGRRGAVAEGEYRRDGFDEANCYVAHHGLPSQLAERAAARPFAVRSVVHPLGQGVVQRIEDFARHCAAVGARCVFSCPPQPQGLLEQSLADMERLVDAIQKIEHITVIDTPAEQIYPIEQFYDTHYHLTREGALRRSRILTARFSTRQ